MELGKPEQNEAPAKHELNGIRRGHYCRLKTDNGFIWAMTTGRQSDVFYGLVESSFPDGPRRGDRISFMKANVFEIL